MTARNARGRTAPRQPSETFMRLTDGGLAFSFEVGVMASQVQRLVEHGKELWRKRWGCDPLNWRDEDYVRYAIERTLAQALAAPSEGSGDA